MTRSNRSPAAAARSRKAKASSAAKRALLEREAVSLEVAPRRRNGRRRHVDRGGLARAAGGGVDREAARVAEQVQHAPIARQLPHARPVVALVEKQAPLLAAPQSRRRTGGRSRGSRSRPRGARRRQPSAPSSPPPLPRGRRSTMASIRRPAARAARAQARPAGRGRRPARRRRRSGSSAARP